MPWNTNATHIVWHSSLGSLACELSHVCLLVTVWTVAHQAPLCMRFSTQEYWSGLLFLFQRIFPTQGSNSHLLFLLHCRRFFTHWANLVGVKRTKKKWGTFISLLCLCSVTILLPGFFVHGILQARILQWVTISYSRGSSRPRNWTCISHVSLMEGGIFTTSTTWEAYSTRTLRKYLIHLWSPKMRGGGRPFKIQAGKWSGLWCCKN